MYCPRKLFQMKIGIYNKMIVLSSFINKRWKYFRICSHSYLFPIRKTTFFSLPPYLYSTFSIPPFGKKILLKNIICTRLAICSRESNPLHLTLCHFYCSQNSESPHSKFKLVEHRVPENSKIWLNLYIFTTSPDST